MPIHWWENPRLELRKNSNGEDLPIRIYDSRTPDNGSDGGPLSTGETREIFVANFTINTWAAVAAAFTVTVVDTVGQGNLTVYPSDLASPPAVSTINWTTSGAVLSTGLVTRLGAGPDPAEPAWLSTVKIACTGTPPAATHFTIDMTACWLLSTLNV